MQFLLPHTLKFNSCSVVTEQKVKYNHLQHKIYDTHSLDFHISHTRKNPMAGGSRDWGSVTALIEPSVRPAADMLQWRRCNGWRRRRPSGGGGHGQRRRCRPTQRLMSAARRRARAGGQSATRHPRRPKRTEKDIDQGRRAAVQQRSDRCCLERVLTLIEAGGWILFTLLRTSGTGTTA